MIEKKKINKWNDKLKDILLEMSDFCNVHSKIQDIALCDEARVKISQLGFDFKIVSSDDVSLMYFKGAIAVAVAVSLVYAGFF